MKRRVMGKICFLFGHRDAPSSVLPEIERAIEQIHLEYGIDEFIAGSHGAFDRMAAQAVRAVQKKYSVRLTLLLAYHPSTQNPDVAQGYDGIFYPDGMERVPPRYALSRANQYMIGRAHAVICYADHTGNAVALWQRAVKQAAERGLIAVNLAVFSKKCI